jgi:hypothetical protein
VSATSLAEGLMFMRAHALSKQSKAVRRYLIAHYAVGKHRPPTLVVALTPF